MAYRALYRIYRPSLFQKVAGQDHITDVLRNQVKLGCLSHAYLFCGPRGTGKTTMAKILSRAVNCLSPIDGEPCGTCEMCRISSSLNADILEIDAASNNGVDNVRELIEQAQFAPLQLKKRVFIIDEVHMLSVSAFNALLKTLEEPPEHVLFILATTEPEKLLATIISRCQRFDFKRLTMADIVAYMAKVLSSEEVTFEEDALRIIAHAADGGMRDALSLLNQCISVAGKNLTVSNVSEVLGSVSEDTVFSMAEKIIIGDGHGCMEILNTVVRNGKDLGVFAKDLSAHMRALLLTSVCGKCADLLEITEDTASRYEKQARSVSKDSLLYYCEELFKTRSSIRYFPNPRMLLETALLRMACPEKERGMEAILARVSNLEKRSDPEQLSRLASLEKTISSFNSSGSFANTQEYKQEPVESVPFEWESATTEASVQTDEMHGNSVAETLVSENNSIFPAAMPEKNSIRAVAEPSASVAAAQSSKSIDKNVGDENTTEAVYKSFKAAIKRINVMAEKLLDSITYKQLIDDRLLLYYDSKNPGGASLLICQPFLSQMQQAADQVKPGLKVLIQDKMPELLSPEDIHMRELFGDKLIME